MSSLYTGISPTHMGAPALSPTFLLWCRF